MGTIAIVLVVLGLVVAQYFRQEDSVPQYGKALVPNVPLQGPPGEVAFAKHCAQCHGNNAVGTDKGPPLVHRYYEPSHHADFSFVRAVRQGVRQHHWRFGNMPPQPKVSKEEIDLIIKYVRELQRSNGIY